MRNISAKFCRQNQNMFGDFSSRNRAVGEAIWKNDGQWGRATDGDTAHVLCLLDN